MAKINSSIHPENRIAILFAAIFPIIAVSIGLHLLHNGWAAILLYHAGMLSVMARYGSFRGLRRHAVSGFRVFPCLVMMVFCAFSGVLVYLLWPLIYSSEIPFGSLLSQYGLGPRSRILFILYFSIIHPVIEESYWRGWFSHSETNVAPWLEDISFATFHVFVLVLFIHPIWILVAFAVLVAIANIWRKTDKHFGGLALPLLSHAVADITIVVAGFIAAS